MIKTLTFGRLLVYPMSMPVLNAGLQDLKPGVLREPDVWPRVSCLETSCYYYKNMYFYPCCLRNSITYTEDVTRLISSTAVAAYGQNLD